MGALSRRKGAAYEREITHRFRDIFGESVKRGIGQERAGSEIADVSGVPNFWVQTKHGKAIGIAKALKQAQTELADSKRTDMWPVAIVKIDGQKATATMDLEDFLEFINEWWQFQKDPIAPNEAAISTDAAAQEME